jgi:hypothetical protein
MAKAIVSRLKASGHPYPDEHVDFPLAGHGLIRPGSVTSQDFGRAPSSVAEGNTVDQQAALVKIREFLRRLS